MSFSAWLRSAAPSSDSVKGATTMPTVSVRYIVNDIDEAIAFYCNNLGFTEVLHPAPTFAMLSRATFASCSAHRVPGREAVRQCLMARCLNRAVGTGSRSR